MAAHEIGKLSVDLEGGLSLRWGDGEVHRPFDAVRDLFARGKDRLTHRESRQDDPGREDYREEFDQEEFDQEGFDQEGFDQEGFDQEGPDGEYYDEPYDEAYDEDADGGDYADEPARGGVSYYSEDDYREDDYREDDRNDGQPYEDQDYDGDYDDQDYDDQDYDDGYDDRDYDDGYDDRDYDDQDYDDQDYGDDGEPYDDGYDDGQPYDDRDYDDRDFTGGGEPYDDRYPVEGEGGRFGALMQYVDEHDWVTYALLFVLPPLGIYLLWRRGRFEMPLRWALTIASAIWFIILLILLFSGALKGGQDTRQNPTISISPVVTSAPTPTPAAQSGDGSGDQGGAGDSGFILDASASPSPTPLTGSSGTSGGTSSANLSYVYSPATGLYYHAVQDCPRIDAGVSISRVSVDVAQSSRKQVPCPDCIGSSSNITFYATRGGKYYHVDPTCSNMKDAEVYTKEAAEQAGKQPCPVCITHAANATPTPLPTAAASGTTFVNSSTTDKSGIEVYATGGGKYFHVRSNCSGMTGAAKGSLKDALLAGKSACPKCCASAGKTVYCTAGGKYYHTTPTCTSMRNAKAVTLAEALVLGKTKCPTCGKSASAGKTTASATTLTSARGSGDIYVYGTQGGKYYHTSGSCSGMKGAKRYTLSAMLKEGRKPCPSCAKSASTKVYAANGGKYYHSYATCSGMLNASSSTLAEALASGFKRCPKCWSETGTAAAATAAAATTTRATASNTYVYATSTSKYYHTNSSCAGMKNARRVTLDVAVNAGKRACPTCASAASRTVYSTSTGKYYHAASSCPESGLKNGTKRTLAEALLMNQTACPRCLGKKATAAATTAVKSTYKSGTSGVKVYTTLSGNYYHTTKSCAGGVQVSLETALNYGKKACPNCATSARRTVYATRGGKYYHYSKADAGSGAKSGTLASALAYGLKACPYCVTRSARVTTTYKSGTSGIKVYANHTNPYFHSKASCSGMTGAYHISLETALNYGKKACPVCLSSGSAKVYAVTGERYYHYYKEHAGSSATAGTLAAAKALGLKQCPVCLAAKKAVAAGRKVTDTGSTNPTIDGSLDDAPTSTDFYTAAPESSVYINIASANNYYHKSSTCKKTGFSNGTGVTLQYAKEWGYKACPFCNPPTDFSTGL